MMARHMVRNIREAVPTAGLWAKLTDLISASQVTPVVASFHRQATEPMRFRRSEGLEAVALMLCSAAPQELVEGGSPTPGLAHRDEEPLSESLSSMSSSPFGRCLCT